MAKTPCKQPVAYRAMSHAGVLCREHCCSASFSGRWVAEVQQLCDSDNQMFGWVSNLSVVDVLQHPTCSDTCIAVQHCFNVEQPLLLPAALLPLDLQPIRVYSGPATLTLQTLHT